MGCGKSTFAQAFLYCCLALTSAQSAEFHVVAVQALTNNNAFVGVPMTNGIRLAIDEVNGSGLVGAGNTIKLTVEDDASNRATALALFTKFANDQSALAIMGPTGTPNSLTVAPLANERKISMITVAGSAEVLKAGPYSFKITESVDSSVQSIAHFAVDKLKVTRCSTLCLSDNEGNLRQRDVFKQIVSGKGVQLVGDHLVKGSDSDFSAIATSIANTNPDCIKIDIPPEQAANAIIQMRQAGLSKSTKIIMSNSGATAAFLRAGGKAVEGVYLFAEFAPGGHNEEGRRFAAEYRKRFSAEPDNWAAMGYTEVKLLAAAIKRAGATVTRETVRNELARLRDVPVILGQGQFMYDETRAPVYGLVLMSIQDSKFVPIN